MQYAEVRQGRVVEPERELPILADVEVVVAGGGPAGLAAAVGAARQGASTLLLERHAFLGGVATSAMMAIFLMSREQMSGFSRELVDRLVARGGAFAGAVTTFDVEAFKETALELVEAAGANLLLYTWIAAPIVQDGAVRGVVVENKSGRGAVLGRVVIDCTGDADLAAAAGVPCVKGRERDGKMRPLTMLFRLGGVDVRRIVEFARAHPEDFARDPNSNVLDLERGVVRICGFFDEVRQARERGEIDPDCHYLRFEGVQVEQGTLFVNSTRVYGRDGTDAADLTRAELEARRQMRQLLGFIKREIPGCGGAFLIDTSTSLGVRETRRIRGEYVFDEADVVAGRSFSDTVYRLYRRHTPGHPMHSPDAGEGSEHDVRQRELSNPLLSFELPYRCLVPLGIDGLLVAGRSISQTHEGDMYTRGMYSCLLMGQAAGAAAAIAAREGRPPRSISTLALQQVLRRQGVDLGQQTARLEAPAGAGRAALGG